MKKLIVLVLLLFGLGLAQDLKDIPTNKQAGVDSLYAWEFNRVVLYLQNISDSLGVSSYMLKVDFGDSLSSTSSTEIIQDLIGAMLSGNTETNITVTYQDGTGKIDFIVDLSESQDVDTTGTKISSALGYRLKKSEFDTYLSNTTSDETIADFIGTMLTGNTETNIDVTYQDSDNTIDFVVSAGAADSSWDVAQIGELRGVTEDKITLTDTLVIGTGGVISGFANIIGLELLETDSLTVNTYLSLPAESITDTYIGTDAVSASELNATGVESELEAVLDLNQLQGSVTDAQVPNNITIDLLPTSGTNPTTDAAGEIAVDTDDHFIEFYSDASRALPALQIKTFTFYNPDSLGDDVVCFHFMADAFPHGATIKDIAISTSAASTDSITVEEWNDRAGSVKSTIEPIRLSGQYTEDDGTLSDADVAAGSFLNIKFDQFDDDCQQLEVTITYFIRVGD